MKPGTPAVLLLFCVVGSASHVSPAAAQTVSGDASAATAADFAAAPSAAPAAPNADSTLSLDQCLETALRCSHLRPAAAFAVAGAEAQREQVLSAYWPQLQLHGAYTRMDQAPDFVFPASSFDFESASVPIPRQDVKLMDPQSFLGSLSLAWLLYDGNLRRGYLEQTQGQVEVMTQEARRTDLEIIDSVKRYYYGAVLARQLQQIGEETLERMQATQDLTETMYQEGSGRVKKTDFLSNQIMTESIRSMVALLDKNVVMARSALANAMGLPWSASVRPSAEEIPYQPISAGLDSLVGAAYSFNPDWGRVEAGLKACEGAVTTAKSGYYPKIALIGDLHKLWNGYDAGLATGTNKDGWTVGLGLELPLFEGFLTPHRIAEARARLKQLAEQRILLREGLGIQIKDVLLSLDAVQKQYQASLVAMQAAVENCDLNTRAYQNELAETKDVIQAQLVEALMKSLHDKTCYEHLTLRSRLDLLVGSTVERQLEKPN